MSNQDNLKLNRRMAIATGCVATLAAGQTAIGAAPDSQQWWSWRGPRGNNQAAPEAKPPSGLTRENAIWSIDIPGRGHSSPIVTKDAVYVTTADKAAGTQSVLAVDRRGKALWGTPVHRGGIPGENHPNNTEASPTLAHDGKFLFASFYNSDGIQLSKLTTRGKLIWQKNLGRYSPNQYKYGYAASPLLYEDKLIVNADYDGDAFLAAVDRESGQPLWKSRRPGKISFSSPVIANVGGRDQLLLSGGEMVAGYDPNNGNILWRADGATTMATCGTMVWDGDMVFASGGYPEAETVGIAADGSGRVVWSNRTKCYEQSMIAQNGYLYAVADSGVAYCWRCTDGKTMWRQRLGGKYSSSPLLVGDTLIVFSESGDGFAFAASPESFQSRGQSKIADEVFASPVVVDDVTYVRAANRTGRRQETLMALR